MSIAFQSVTKRYAGTPNPAVNSISFSAPTGSLTTILGPSGCGKTTTLRMIAGLETPTSGQVWIGGKDVTRLAAHERDVSMVFQSYALFPHMNVLRNVMYGLSVSGVNAEEAAQRAEKALAQVGLRGLGERLPSEISGGQQQRVALARSLILEPAVLLFDEPLSNLDARLRRDMRDEIRALQQRLKLTVAYVTHDQSEALAVSDQIIVMNQGVIAQSGTPQALYEQPSNAFVAHFMGEATLLDGETREDGVYVAGVRLPQGAQSSVVGSSKGKVKVAVRPHGWRLVAASDAVGGSGRENTFSGSLVSKAYQGSHVELKIALKGANSAQDHTVLVNAGVEEAAAVGSKVSLQLQPGAYSVVPV